MSSAKMYIRTDEHGVLRVSQSRVMLDSIVAGFYQGDSPESIQQQYPALTLEDVYGALAYYLANQKEVDEYLQRQGKIWNAWREQAEQQPSQVLQRLRALNHEGVAKSRFYRYDQRPCQFGRHCVVTFYACPAKYRPSCHCFET